MSRASGIVQIPCLMHGLRMRANTHTQLTDSCPGHVSDRRERLRSPNRHPIHPGRAKCLCANGQSPLVAENGFPSKQVE